MARSRIHQAPAQKKTRSRPAPTKVAPLTRVPRPPIFSSKRITKFFAHRTRFLLHGGAGAVVLYWLFLTLTTRHPHELQNVLVTNSYLPVLLALFIALFGISSFFWADARRGWITALGSTLLVFFRLQHVVFELWWLLPLLSIFGILLIVYKTKKTASS